MLDLLLTNKILYLVDLVEYIYIYNLYNVVIYNHTSKNRVKPGVITPYLITIGNPPGEVVVIDTSGGGSQGDSVALGGHSCQTNPTFEFGVFHGFFIIPKRSQSQNCQGGVFLFFFQRRWDCSTALKESESQSERDVPNGWIQIDDIKPTVDC